MGDIAIQVERLSKRYTIGRLQVRADTLHEYLVEGVKSLFSRNGRSPDTSLWALRDVSFDVRHSEVLGLIGANGSGKSTLLKILSRITEPTAGRARIYGRVASLLEVGTGFDRDLTGRENVYLSGAVLGMRRAEIRRKFDEIVAFSGVERFLDTPVKRYSSGMYVRLAFAVAAHLDPDILLIDEVLAVGDERFQRKCLDKVSDLGQMGRTVVFVSHSMSAVTRLCQRAILLQDGRVVKDGPSREVVSAYSSGDSGALGVREWRDPARAPSGRVARLRAVRVRAVDGRVVDAVDIREPVALELEYEVLEDGHILMPSFRLYNSAGIYLFSAQELDPAWRKTPRPCGRYVGTVWLPGEFLQEGRHFVDASLCVLHPVIPQFNLAHVVSFQVVEGPEMGLARGEWRGDVGGVIRPLLKWTTQFTPGASRVLREASGT